MRYDGPEGFDGAVSFVSATAFTAARAEKGAGIDSPSICSNEPIFAASRHSRSGPAQMFSEFVATFGLLVVIWGCVRLRSSVVPFAVGAYITGAYWFTSSTSFANPAVTLARSMTDTFSGIRPNEVPGFVVAQLAGSVAATALFAWLIPPLRAEAKDVVVPHLTHDR